jgi:hypothetical protein
MDRLHLQIGGKWGLFMIQRPLKIQGYPGISLPCPALYLVTCSTTMSCATIPWTTLKTPLPIRACCNSPVHCVNHHVDVAELAGFCCLHCLRLWHRPRQSSMLIAALRSIHTKAQPIHVTFLSTHPDHISFIARATMLSIGYSCSLTLLQMTRCWMQIRTYTDP